MTDAKKPMACANSISSMLNTVLGADRFPVKVDELALEYSRQCFRRLADRHGSGARISTVSMVC